MSLSQLEHVSIVAGIVVPVVTLAVAVLKLYLDLRKAKQEAELSKKYLQHLTKLVESQVSKQQLERNKFEWDKLRDIGKALGWILNRSEE